MTDDPVSNQRLGGVLPTTRWTLIDALEGTVETRQQALELLASAYWPPVYSFTRLKGFSPEDAEDLTQEFLLSFIESDSFNRASAEKGRLRSYLLAALNHFLANERRRRKRKKRGGRFAHVSIEREVGERGFADIAGRCPTPEAAFDQQWGICLLEHALERVADLYRKEGKENHFEVLAPMIGGLEGRKSFAEAGEELGLKEASARVAAFRLRKRLRRILREEVARTVIGEAEIDDELDALFAMFTGASPGNPFEPSDVSAPHPGKEGEESC